MINKIRRLVIINEVNRFYVLACDSRNAVELAMGSFLSIYPDAEIKEIKLMPMSPEAVLDKAVLHHRIY